MSSWGACDANHITRRTCREDCGTDNCASIALTADCVANITGTLFDASDVESCSGVSSLPKFTGQTLGITPTVVNTWPIINPPVVTDANGFYSEQVYAPATYQIDLTDILSSGLVTGVKLVCAGYQPTVTSYGQTVVHNFGFWKVYSGWWQVVGGSVYARDGVISKIPSTLNLESQKRLILPDANNRYGFFAYGIPWVSTMLGTNPNARVSDVLWRVESVYEGLRYDYNLYNTRMDIFDKTDWDGGEVFYDDGGRGYQIYKHTGDVNIQGLTLSAGQKAVFLVDGNVKVSGDLITPDGAFLSIIASQGITFDYNVTTAQGWFVAEDINVPCHDGNSDGLCDKDDVQFAGEGSFVGWSNINLGRDQGVTNNTQPSELFTYRSNFMLDMPKPMKVYTRKFTPFIP